MADRCPLCNGEVPCEPQLQCGPVTLSVEAQEVSFEGHAVSLTNYETKILALLFKRQGTVVHKDVLFDYLYGSRDDGGPDDKILTIWICKIRAKIRYTGAPDIIGTAWGRGWTARAPQDSPLTQPARSQGAAQEVAHLRAGASL